MGNRRKTASYTDYEKDKYCAIPLLDDTGSANGNDTLAVPQGRPRAVMVVSAIDRSGGCYRRRRFAFRLHANDAPTNRRRDDRHTGTKTTRDVITDTIIIVVISPGRINFSSGFPPSRRRRFG